MGFTDGEPTNQTHPNRRQGSHGDPGAPGITTWFLLPATLPWTPPPAEEDVNDWQDASLRPPRLTVDYRERGRVSCCGADRQGSLSRSWSSGRNSQRSEVKLSLGDQQKPSEALKQPAALPPHSSRWLLLQELGQHLDLKWGFQSLTNKPRPPTTRLFGKLFCLPLFKFGPNQP